MNSQSHQFKNKTAHRNSKTNIFYSAFHMLGESAMSAAPEIAAMPCTRLNLLRLPPLFQYVQLSSQFLPRSPFAAHTPLSQASYAKVGLLSPQIQNDCDVIIIQAQGMMRSCHVVTVVRVSDAPRGRSWTVVSSRDEEFRISIFTAPAWRPPFTALMPTSPPP